MPPPTIVCGKHNVFGLSVRPSVPLSVRPLSTDTYIRVTRSLHWVERF